MKNSETFLTNTSKGRPEPNWDYIYDMLVTSDYKGKGVKKQILDDLKEAFEIADGYKCAVEDACITVYVDWDDTNPRRTVNKLIDAETTIALDPRVSVEARKLISQGVNSWFEPGT